MRPIILFCVVGLLRKRRVVAHKWPPKAFCLTAAIPAWRGCGRRVFTRRQPVDRVRPVDVGFQVNFHCVSVSAVNLFFKTGLIIVAVCGVLAAGMLGKLVGLWLVSEDFDLISVDPVVITTTGGVLGLIGGIIIVTKLIKPIFKLIKRDAKQIKPIKRFKK